MTKKFLETKTLNFPEIENEILKFWDGAEKLKKSKKPRTLWVRRKKKKAA